MASLTEAAKAVLEGKVLEEGAYPEVSPGKISNPNPVDPSTASTGNAKTLRPGSKSVEGRHTNPGASDPKSLGTEEDLGGQTPTSLPTENLGAKASGKVGKDTSKSSRSSVAPEAKKSLKSQPAMAEEMEEEGEALVAEDNAAAVAERVAIIKEAAKKSKMKHDDDDHEDDDDDKCMKEEEEFELSEELEAFINEGIEAGLSEEEILAAIDENFEIISEEEELEESAVEDYQVDMSEHVDALLAGEDLSEEFHAKATTIFEAAVKAKLEEEVALLEQAYAETLEERVAEIQAQLAEDVDNYLNYVVEQWIEENEVAVESALRSELTEDFISGLRSLFAEHYIDIPEDSVNVVEELSQTVESLETKLNEEINRNVELTSMISESRKSELTSYVCEGLTTTQAEKLKSLVEGVEYSNDDEFITKISTLRENYFPATVKTDNVLDKVEVSDDPQALVEGNLNGPMAKYVQAIGKTKLI
jgi:hypothetical protein